MTLSALIRNTFNMRRRQPKRDPHQVQEACHSSTQSYSTQRVTLLTSKDLFQISSKISGRKARIQKNTWQNPHCTGLDTDGPYHGIKTKWYARPLLRRPKTSPKCSRALLRRCMYVHTRICRYTDIDKYIGLSVCT
jgi:hypothetical protein